MNPAWHIPGWAVMRFTGPEPEKLPSLIFPSAPTFSCR